MTFFLTVCAPLYGTPEGDKAKGSFAYCLWKTGSWQEDIISRSLLFGQAAVVFGIILLRAKREDYSLDAMPETTTWFIYVAGVAYFIGTFWLCRVPSFSGDGNGDLPFWALYVLLNAGLAAM